MKHTIEKTDDGFTCITCKWQWKSRPHSACPGVVRYQWQAAPENLKTDGQLKKKHLHTGPIRGIVGDWYLYDINEATPWTAEEIAAEKERNLIQCTICGRKIDKARWSVKWECCRTKKCLKAAIEKEEEELRLRHEAEQREFEEMIIEARDEQIKWARGLLTRSDWVVLDTETTGLDAYVDEVISIAIVDQKGEILLNTLSKLSRPLPEIATVIHGITNEMLAEAPSWIDIFPQICDVLKDRLVLAYNKEFDYDMITGTCSINHIKGSGELLPDYRKGWEDVMFKYAAFVGEWHEYYGDFRWQSLPRGNHQASGDCLAVIDLIKQMAAAKLSREKETNLVSAAPEISKQEGDHVTQRT